MDLDIRVLLLADTHLGYDDPLRPRVVRRRRGPDFLANYLRALEPALRGEVDLLVHGGDLFYRSRIPAALVALAFEPLARVAKAGVGVFVVPGNHERGRIPFPLLARHPGISVFDRPRTLRLDVRGHRIAVGGFPFVREVGAGSFVARVHETGLLAHDAGLRLLCIHEPVEGARVGPQDFTFRRGPDVVPGRSIPAGLAAVLAGHIHRAQVLEHDLDGRRLAAPVVYPGSVERTAFAERGEAKGYQRLTFRPDSGGGRLTAQRFVPLPTRPMAVVEVDGVCANDHGIRRRVRRHLARIPPDAVVRLIVRGSAEAKAEARLTAASLREIAPRTMTVELARPAARPRGRPA